VPQRNYVDVIGRCGAELFAKGCLIVIDGGDNGNEEMVGGLRGRVGNEASGGAGISPTPTRRGMTRGLSFACQTWSLVVSSRKFCMSEFR
jgi:hypothetical protein